MNSIDLTVVGISRMVMAKVSLMLVLTLAVASCASLPAGSLGWLLSAPAQEVTVGETPYRVLKHEIPDTYFAVHRDAMGYVNADLQYVLGGVKAIEIVSGCLVVERQVLENIYIEALVDCPES
ncbi:hypothetical protein FGK63_20330 [Ruegeria sediminis]|uniref:Uncharacterized protein n=1 Tax=Ruegeria sediminis TaxID=2583820 RepID=A0ABY2WSY1_9RHOB|nr:hypothetical protein [Ruegeria sediminis]TMV02577.1 hypothetical protein FGK63_20330 [Ruegeria sediminis]